MPHRTCSVDGCNEPVTEKSARGLCVKHYYRWWKHGDPLGGGRVRRRRGSPPPSCAIDGCTAPCASRGWCRTHYGRWLRHGDPLALPPRARKDPADRYWPKVDKDGPIPAYAPGLGACWLWTAGTDDKGYGHFYVPGPPPIHLAHVWSYVDKNGPVPDGLELDHLCRVPSCVRPDHLEPVTHQVNTKRGIPGWGKGLTHCPATHPYDAANTYVTPGGYKVCRKCRADQDRERYLRKKEAADARRGVSDANGDRHCD